MRSLKRNILLVLLVLAVIFLGWRFLRPMQVFIVSPAFERPTDTSTAPAMFPTLRAEECATCHRDVYDEWSTTIHSQAWTDPYFQVDWRFDGSPQICKNCHIPLDRQQEFTVTGFNDAEKWDPILQPNPDFDPALQHEGVTCNVCHYRDRKILGVMGDTAAPHPVEKLDDPNRICVRCHVVSGERWDTFFKFPPCGTVAEIQTSRGMAFPEDSGDMTTKTVAALGCVDCHMPLVERPLVPGGPTRPSRRHLWRGGHDPDMVKNGLSIRFDETTNSDPDKRRFTLTLANTGAAHHIPTGTPDRHLTVRLRVLDGQGQVLNEEQAVLKRTVMWRPFIVDLWDTRLPRGETREYAIDLSENQAKTATVIEAQVHYHLLDEARRKRIGYENTTPIHYPVFQKQRPITSLTRSQP
ncbi:MAG: hypothetical protein RRB22_06965 [Gammaproteobacteria bacterium]|nr:hypothetical protein [Gammaproteobacteria bacterium]